MRRVVLSLLILSCACNAASESIFNVKDYGALGNGVTKDTNPITKAIYAVERNGHGTVYFPAGRYLTGALNLTSNIVLRISEGATILGSKDEIDYPVIPPLPSYGISRHNGAAARYQSLIYALNKNNITITGGGVVDGQGAVWWERFYNKSIKWGRGRLIELQTVNDIVISDLLLTQSPFWTLHPIYANNVLIKNVTIINPELRAPNTDGIDPDSCTNMLITGCKIWAGDDVIAIKSGFDAFGRNYGKPTENLTITDCYFGYGHGLSIGSEMSGNVINGTIKNSILNGTLSGPKIKTARGRGGIVSDIVFENLHMINISVGINIGMYYEGRLVPPTNATATPIFRNFRFSNITGTKILQAGSFDCLPESNCERMKFEDIKLESKSGWTCSNAQGTESNVSPALSCLQTN